MSSDLTIPSSVPVLNGSNYKEWERMMRFLLQTKGLYQYLKSDFVRPRAPNALENDYIRMGPLPATTAVPGVAAVPATATTAAIPAIPPIPAEPAITQQMVDDAKAIKKAFDDWVVEDDRILGAIMMKCSPTIQQINASVNSARVIWQKLEEQYGVSISAGIFNDFQLATNWKFEGNKDPTQSLNDLLAIINRLAHEGILLPDNVQAVTVKSGLGA
jgi:hypothetical protein